MGIHTQERHELTLRQTLSHQYIHTLVLQQDPTSATIATQYTDLADAIVLPMDRSSRQHVDQLVKEHQLG